VASDDVMKPMGNTITNEDYNRFYNVLPNAGGSGGKRKGGSVASDDVMKPRGNTITDEDYNRFYNVLPGKGGSKASDDVMQGITEQAYWRMSAVMPEWMQNNIIHQGGGASPRAVQMQALYAFNPPYENIPRTAISEIDNPTEPLSFNYSK